MTDPSSREVLANVLYQYVILKPQEGGGLGPSGAVAAQKKKGNGTGNMNFPLEQAMKASNN